MDEQPSTRVPAWLTIDFIIIALGLVILGVGIWIGFDGRSFPLAILTQRGP
jgi:hypothetical protein